MRNVKLTLAALALIGSSMAVSTVSAQEPWGQGDSFQKTMLETHNQERRTQRLQPLVWDQRLANDAAVWAESLASSNRFEHATREIRAKKQGENLWMGTKNYFSQVEMVDGWISEKAMTKSGTFPDVSTNGDWSEVGHYTQIIWPETRSIGCALGKNQRKEVLVCRYWPAGNRIGDKFIVRR